MIGRVNTVRSLTNGQPSISVARASVALLRVALLRVALLRAAFALSFLAATAHAQSLSDASVFAGPQFVSYKFGDATTQKTVSQLSVPFAIIVPFGEKFNLDLSSSYASSEVHFAGKKTSAINGLTDVQLRGNYTLGDNVGVLTLGLNLPSGMYKVPEGQQEAAGQIGNDFLVYPVSSMGSGLSTTGGIGFAQPVGDWNFGFGASFRRSTKFDAYVVKTQPLRFTPGDEYRLRLGVDRPVGDGRVSMGLTYSRYGKDAADSTTFATGDRALAQAALSIPLGGADFSISAWNLFRAEGERIGDKAPWENVADVTAALGFQLGGLFVQPSAEGRIWQVAGVHAGTLGNAGLRLRFDLAGLSINPSATYTVGRLYSTADGSTTDVTGFRASLLIRLH